MPKGYIVGRVVGLRIQLRSRLPMTTAIFGKHDVPFLMVRQQIVSQTTTLRCNERAAMADSAIKANIIPAPIDAKRRWVI